VQLQFGGEREFGGSVQPGKFYRVGEAGEEMFAPASAGTIIPNRELGGAPVTVNVHNYGSDRVEVRERDDDDGKKIDIFIRKIKKSIASDLSDGIGEVTQALQSSYVGLRRGTA
jgi:hypothetical protein